MSKPCISVIIPVYNMEKYLHKCVDSILNQTHANLEVILVDDGSVDGSPRICDEYGEKDKRVKVLHKENAGQGSARNLALDIITGDYVSFIDSDDWITSDFYEKLLSLSEQYDADMVQCGNFQVFDSSEITIPISETKRVAAHDRIAAMQAHLTDIITQGPCNKLYRRKLWETIRFPLNRLLEDAATLYLIIDKVSKIVVTTEKMYYVRCDINSVSRRKFNPRRYDVYKSYLEMESFLEQKSEYQDILPLVQGKKIGILFYLMGELYKNGLMMENSLLVKQLVDNCRTLKRECGNIPLKQRILINLMIFSPSIFGLVYKMRK